MWAMASNGAAFIYNIGILKQGKQPVKKLINIIKTYFHVPVVFHEMSFKVIRL